MDRLISEQAVIESIEFFQMNPQHFDFVNLIDDIKNIPSAEQRWISVDDKLPKENQQVLVIYRSIIGDTEKMDIDFIKRKYWQNHGGVLAWMPLPEWEE